MNAKSKPQIECYDCWYQEDCKKLQETNGKKLCNIQNIE